MLFWLPGLVSRLWRFGVCMDRHEAVLMFSVNDVMLCCESDLRLFFLHFHYQDLLCNGEALLLPRWLCNSCFCNSLLLWADVILLFSRSAWRLRCPSRARQDTAWESWVWAVAPWCLRGRNRASYLSSNQTLHHLHNLRYTADKSWHVTSLSRKIASKF